MPPKFHAGQTVRISGSFPYRNAAEGFYEIIRPLPYEGDGYRYRVRSAREEFDRVMKESELEEI